MSFMKPEIWQDSYHLVQGRCGSTVYDSTYGLPAGETDPEVIASYLDCQPEELIEIEYHPSGWLYRLSAPGYLDCTETGSAETEAEAIKAILDLYGNDDGEPEDWEEELRERLQELSR